MQPLKVASLLLLCLMAYPLTAQKKKNVAIFRKLYYVEKGDSLPYRLLEPLPEKAEDRYPLIIFLHGAGERGRENEDNINHIKGLFDNKQDKYPCYVVAPQCPKRESWTELMGPPKALSPTPTRPMQLTLKLLDELLKTYPIDKSRIYVIGVSMGGFGTWDLLARFPNRFAAAVPICGGGDESTAPRFKQVPLWVFHGALDDVVPPERSRTMVKALQDAGGKPGYTEFPAVKHNSWTQAFREPLLWTWLFRQQVGKAPEEE